MESEKQQIIACIKSLQESMMGTRTYSMEEYISLKETLDAHFTALQVLEHPELKDRTCPLCGGTFSGWGNNPAPLKVKGEVCDKCNNTRVIPARLRR